MSEALCFFVTSQSRVRFYSGLKYEYILNPTYERFNVILFVYNQNIGFCFFNQSSLKQFTGNEDVLLTLCLNFRNFQNVSNRDCANIVGNNQNRDLL